MLLNLPDEEFDGACAEIRELFLNRKQPMNNAEFLHAQEKIRTEKYINYDSTEFMQRKITNIDIADMEEEILKKVTKTISPDIIHLTGKQDGKLQEIWRKIGRQNVLNEINIPSDIFFANTIPLKDCEIEVDESDITTEDGFAGAKSKSRIVIYDDFFDRIKNSDDIVDVGYVVMLIPGIINEFIGISICAQKGYDSLMCMQAPFMTQGFIHSSFDAPLYMIHNWFSSYLATWYSIQISLLNPRTQTIYLNGCSKVKNKDYRKAKTDDDRKRIAKYIKHYYLKDGDIDNAIYGETGGKGINRKCLVWYVIGHWRTYKNGKQVFIQPYWKGELREIKRNLNERERIIDNE